MQPAGTQAVLPAEIGWVLIVGATLIFLGVLTLLAWTLRRRVPSTRGGRAGLWVVGGGFVFPVLVLSALLAYTTWRAAALAERQPAELVVSVRAHMWWWELRYTDPATGADVVTANELRLPVGRTVSLGLTSADVIHSFWVPALAGKVDMLPGRVHQLQLLVEQAGVFRGPCAEYCGEQHARMTLEVVAMPPEDFDRWLAGQARPARAPTDTLAQRGQAVFIAERCTACHAVRGVSEGSALGPDLTHLGSRRLLGAGVLPNDRAHLARWIAGVQQHKPGARMPSFDRLDAASLDALAAFLEQLE